MACIFLPLSLEGHDRSKGKSFFTFFPDGTMNIQIGMNNLDFLDWAGIDLGSPNNIDKNQQAAERFLTYTLPKQLRIEMLPGGVSCPVKYKQMEQPDHRNIEIFAVAFCPPSQVTQNHSLRMDWGLFIATPLKHTSFSQLQVNGQTLKAWAFSDRHRKEIVSIKSPSLPDTLMSFAQEGFWHLITGWDHLWFLLLLFLSCPTFKTLIIWITTFTLAHALSLLASYLGFVQLPGHWVECGIALSICLAAWPAWKQKSTPLQPHASTTKAFLIILGFGLLHGLGFASFLTELLAQTQSLYWALFSFHVGLELAQVLFLVGCLVLLWPLRTKKFWPQVQGALALSAFAFGLFWLWERLFGLS